MRRHLSAGLLLLALSTACLTPEEGASTEGDEVGTYQVQASLTDNQCGEGHPAPAALDFVVDLAHLPGSTRGYWKLPDGPQLEGELERGAGFRFVSSSDAVAIEPDPNTGAPGCSVTRTEIVEGTLEAGEDAAPDAGPDAPGEERLVGTTTVRITAVPGGDCTALLSVYGGPFPTLPCDLEYDLAGERME